MTKELNNELLNAIKAQVLAEKSEMIRQEIFESWAEVQKYYDEVCIRYAEEVNKAPSIELSIENLQHDLNKDMTIKLLEQQVECLKVSVRKSCEATYKQATKEASAIVDQYRLIEWPGTIAAKIDFLKPNIVIIE